MCAQSSAGESKTVYNRREAVRRCAEVVGLESIVDGFELSFAESSGEVFLRAQQLPEPPEKSCVARVSRDKQLGARSDQGCSVQCSGIPENYGTFAKATETLRKTGRIPGPPVNKTRTPHVADAKQRNYLGARRLVDQELVKWPVPGGSEIADKIEAVNWPRSARA